MGTVRIPISDWTGDTLCWSTQFNDLRDPDSIGSTEHSREMNTRRELKRHALFDESLVIRDADVVNNLALLKLFKTNKQQVRTLVQSGLIVFALREDAGSFSDVNEQARERRAYPERYALARPLLPSFDSFLSNEQARIAITERTLTSGTFPKLLERILASEQLSDYQFEILSSALEIARETAGHDHVRFGDIYSLISHASNTDRSAVSDLIQWCRTAHVLTVPYEVGVAPTSSDRDLNPVRVSLILGNQRKGATLRENPWYEFYPGLIPSSDWLDALSFERIVRLRDHGLATGYFASIVGVQTLDAESVEFDAAFKTYLSALGDYIDALQTDTHSDFIDWKLMAEKAAESKEIRDSLLFKIPVIAGAMLGMGFLYHHSPIPPVIQPITAIGGSLLEPALKQIAKGNTRTAAKKKTRT